MKMYSHRKERGKEMRTFQTTAKEYIDKVKALKNVSSNDIDLVFKSLEENAESPVFRHLGEIANHRWFNNTDEAKELILLLKEIKADTLKIGDKIDIELLENSHFVDVLYKIGINKAYNIGLPADSTYKELFAYITVEVDLESSTISKMDNNIMGFLSKLI